MTNEENSAPEETVDGGSMSFDPDEIAAAANLENASMQQATIQYLNSRVTVLRAAVTRLSAENADLKDEIRELHSREE